MQVDFIFYINRFKKSTYFNIRLITLITQYNIRREGFSRLHNHKPYLPLDPILLVKFQSSEWAHVKLPTNYACNKRVPENPNEMLLMLNELHNTENNVLK